MTKQKIWEKAKKEAVKLSQICGCENDKEFIENRARFFYQVDTDNLRNMAREAGEGNQQLK